MQYSANADLLGQVAKEWKDQPLSAAEVSDAVRALLATVRMTLRVMALIFLQFG